MQSGVRQIRVPQRSFGEYRLRSLCFSQASLLHIRAVQPGKRHVRTVNLATVEMGVPQIRCGEIAVLKVRERAVRFS